MTHISGTLVDLAARVLKGQHKVLHVVLQGPHLPQAQTLQASTTTKRNADRPQSHPLTTPHPTFSQLLWHSINVYEANCVTRK